MPSCSADRPDPDQRQPGRPEPDRRDHDPARGSWRRLVVVVLLAAAALSGPAVGYASARFGDTATVTISVTVGPRATDEPGASPSGAPESEPPTGPDDAGPVDAGPDGVGSGGAAP